MTRHVRRALLVGASILVTFVALRVYLHLFPGMNLNIGDYLDEWVYLITTDGSDSSYLLPVSLWGGMAMVSLALSYLLVLVFFACRCARPNSPLQPTQSQRG